jgi:hypothetical protein
MVCESCASICDYCVSPKGVKQRRRDQKKYEREQARENAAARKRYGKNASDEILF